MIICEGTDNGGKTTLAKKLSLEFDLKIIKSSGPPESKESLIERVKYSLEQSRKGINFLYDRYPLISEWIYGPVLRNKNLLDNEEGNQLWKEFIEIKPLIIYCRPPYLKIADFGRRKQMKGVREKIDSLIIAYDNFIYRIKEIVNIISYNYMDKADWEVYMEVRKYLKEDRISE